MLLPAPRFKSFAEQLARKWTHIAYWEESKFPRRESMVCCFAGADLQQCSSSEDAVYEIKIVFEVCNIRGRCCCTALGLKSHQPFFSPVLFLFSFTNGVSSRRCFSNCLLWKQFLIKGYLAVGRKSSTSSYCETSIFAVFFLYRPHSPRFELSSFVKQWCTSIKWQF